jgi:hypothetical protein
LVSRGALRLSKKKGRLRGDAIYTGRCAVSPNGYWTVIITGANRHAVLQKVNVLHRQSQLVEYRCAAIEQRADRRA